MPSYVVHFLQFRDVAEDLKVGGAKYRFVHDFAKSVKVGGEKHI
jgi:hypothetical protein